MPRIPFVHPAPATITAVLAMHAGQICASAAARPLVDMHLQGFTSRICEALAEPMQHAAEDIFDIRLHLDPLYRVQDQIVNRHPVSLYVIT
jgi:hypothetical protein